MLSVRQLRQTQAFFFSLASTFAEKQQPRNQKRLNYYRTQEAEGVPLVCFPKRRLFESDHGPRRKSFFDHSPSLQFAPVHSRYARRSFLRNLFGLFAGKNPQDHLANSLA